jgi:hypothetical protein
MSAIRWGRTRAGAKWHAVEWEPGCRNAYDILSLCRGEAVRRASISSRWTPAPYERCKACARRVKAVEGEPDGK